MPGRIERHSPPGDMPARIEEFVPLSEVGATGRDIEDLAQRALHEHEAKASLDDLVTRLASHDPYMLMVLTSYMRPLVANEAVYNHRYQTAPRVIEEVAHFLTEAGTFYVAEEHLLQRVHSEPPPSNDAYEELYSAVRILVHSAATSVAGDANVISAPAYHASRLRASRVEAYTALRILAGEAMRHRAREVELATPATADVLLFHLVRNVLEACIQMRSWLSPETHTRASEAYAEMQRYGDMGADVSRDPNANRWRSHPALDIRFLRWRNHFLLAVLTVPLVSVFEPARRY